MMDNQSAAGNPPEEEIVKAVLKKHLKNLQKGSQNDMDPHSMDIRRGRRDAGAFIASDM